MNYELSLDELKLLKKVVNKQYLEEKKGTPYYYTYKYLSVKLNNMIEMMEEMESANT